MKIDKVKQFVSSNISRFEKDNFGHRFRSFSLYDRNNAYRGEYSFVPIHSSDYHGVKSSMSVTHIMSNKLEQEIQEIVYMNKQFVTLKDKNFDTLTKALPSEIMTVTTVMDFLNDKFKTVMTISKLKNKLQRLGKNDPDFVHSDSFEIYEPLKGKPQYEKNVEYVREGSISETNSKNQIPYKFW